MPQDWVLKIQSLFGSDFYSTDADTLKSYGQDWTRFHVPCPTMVVFPKNTAEVSQVLRICSEFGVAVVPSGGRTGLAGGAVAANGELVLSLKKLNAMGTVDPVALSLRVGAGVVTEAVHERAAQSGLHWPIDLAAKGSSTIGGNISTNAGGLRVIRYGHTRNWVQSLEVVLMNGEILEISGDLEKNNTGYDLRHLLIGSEGTLGVVTAATLRLVPKMPPQSTLFFGLSSIEKVLGLLGELRRTTFVPTAFEVLTQECMKAVCHQMNRPRAFADEHPLYCLVEIEKTQNEQELMDWIETILEKNIVNDGTLAQNSNEVKKLWGYRENITESLSQMGRVYKNDIAVPIAMMSQFFSALWQAFPAWYPGCRLFLFGHLGDGNIHVNVLKPEDMKEREFLELCEKRNHDLFSLIKKYSGSIAAEHGIGLLKKAYLQYSRSPTEIEIFRAIKKSFDPKGLLNPGKIF